MKSFRLRQEDVERRWVQVDARNQVLGRLAVKVARMLMGKEHPTYTPGVDSGDVVVVTGAQEVRVTGKKETDKLYRYHTGWIGHLRERPLAGMREKKPENIVRLAVKRMLPKNKLGRAMYRRLKVYPGDQHPHEAQSPVKVSLPTKKSEWHAAAALKERP